jgi:BolA protein
MSLSLHQLITERLSTLEPIELKLQDDSHLHAGHVGNQGGGHFQVKVVSSHFSGKSQIMRHRMVYQILNDLIPQKIHAISILAISPDDSI